MSDLPKVAKVTLTTTKATGDGNTVTFDFISGTTKAEVESLTTLHFIIQKEQSNENYVFYPGPGANDPEMYADPQAVEVDGKWTLLLTYMVVNNLNQTLPEPSSSFIGGVNEVSIWFENGTDQMPTVSGNGLAPFVQVLQ